MTSPTPDSSRSAAEPAQESVQASEQPVHADPVRIVAWGCAAWTVALVATLAVPSLHSGGRDWWPWTCVSGLTLGLLGLMYLLRGRGNAADVR